RTTAARFPGNIVERLRNSRRLPTPAPGPANTLAAEMRENSREDSRPFGLWDTAHVPSPWGRVAITTEERNCVARPAEEVMSPEPGAAFGKGGQHYTTDCPISRIGTAGREPSRNPRAERLARTTDQAQRKPKGPKPGAPLP